MQKTAVCASTYVYLFDELRPYVTTVTVLLRPAHAFVFDTFLGERYMRAIDDDLGREWGDRKIVVINSHAHFDHVWGNSFFTRARIVSSALCRETLCAQWDADVEAHQKYADAKPCCRLPDEILTGERFYEADSVLLFPSPGHTADGLSLYDSANGLLLVGDNVERPLAQLESTDLSAYADTLRRYLALEPRHIVGGHNAVLTREDLVDTLQYVLDLQANTPRGFPDAEAERVHLDNLDFLKQAGKD